MSTTEGEILHNNGINETAMKEESVSAQSESVSSEVTDCVEWTQEGMTPTKRCRTVSTTEGEVLHDNGINETALKEESSSAQPDSVSSEVRDGRPRRKSSISLRRLLLPPPPRGETPTQIINCFV